MNKELLETQWPQIREMLKEKFSNLTEEDIRQINGRYDQLVNKLQQKYGYTREEAEDRIRNWNFERFTGTAKGPVIREDKSYRDDKVRREPDTSTNFLKWLFLLIPLLLLGAYFFGTAKSPEPTTTPPSTNEQVFTETSADRVISNGIRNALVSQQILSSDLRNVQITTHNGTVTLNGTVSNNEIRDSIERIANNFTGVQQVVNNLQIR